MSAIQVRRILPGVAVRDNRGNIPFYPGKVIYASERIQYVQVEHPEHKLAFLISDTYAFWCERCSCTLWQQELNPTAANPAGHFHRGVPHCPFCIRPVRALRPGDPVRMHYRYMPDASSAQWWGEMWPA